MTGVDLDAVGRRNALLARMAGEDAAMVAPSDVELAGLSVLVNVMERMTDDERGRALRYLTDRYGAR